MVFFAFIPHLLTKSLKTPLYKGVFRGEVCPRYLTRTSLDDSPQVEVPDEVSSEVPSEVQVRYLRHTSPLESPLFKGVSRDLVSK